MKSPASLFAAGLLAALSLLHLVWLASRWPLESQDAFARTVLGTTDPARFPTPPMTVAVALALAAAAGLVLAGGRWIRWPLPAALLPSALWVLASVLLARSVGGLVVSGVLHLPTPEFIAADLRIYSPLCLVLAALIARVARHAYLRSSQPPISPPCAAP